MNKMFLSLTIVAFQIFSCNSASSAEKAYFNVILPEIAKVGTETLVPYDENKLDLYYYPAPLDWKFVCTGYSTSYNKSKTVKQNSALRINYQGIKNWEKGKFKNAIADFSESRVLCPWNFYPLHNRAVAKFYSYDLNGAIADIDKAITLSKKCNSMQVPVSFYRLRKYLLLKQEGLDLIIPKQWKKNYYPIPPKAEELNSAR